MSKRFIDTGLFDDPWFMELSDRAKLFWILLITKCDHAGVVRENDRLFQFYLSANSLETVYEELSNRLVRLKDGYIFIPKFIQFQYPKGLDLNVKAQKSVIDILTSHGLYSEGSLTVPQELQRSLVTPQDKDKDTDKDMDRDKDSEINIPFDEFWNLYDYKDSRERCRKYWIGKSCLVDSSYITADIRQAIMDYLPAYIKATPDKQFRKKPAKWLYNMGWENEIAKRTDNKPSYASSAPTYTKDMIK